MSATAERQYAMTRVQAGDYLFPSNDAKTLWRVSSYQEYRSLIEYPADDRWGMRSPGRRRPVYGTFWQAAKFNGTIDEATSLLERDPDEFLSWDRWITSVMGQPTRRAAIEEAIRA